MRSKRYPEKFKIEVVKQITEYNRCYLVGLRHDGIVMLPPTFHYQLQKEALHHPAIPTAAFAAYAATNAMSIR